LNRDGFDSFTLGAAPLQKPGHQVNILDIFKAEVTTGLHATYHGIKKI
jgi:hypothetical protein